MNRHCARAIIAALRAELDFEAAEQSAVVFDGLYAALVEDLKD